MPAYAAERRAVAPLLLGAGSRRCQSITPARTALSSKPVARRCCCRSMEQTDGRTLDSFIYPAVRSMGAVSLNKLQVNGKPVGGRFRTVALTHTQIDGQAENRMFPDRSAVLAETQ